MADNGAVTRENGHSYPDQFAPGPDKPWALNAAWEILDYGGRHREGRAVMGVLIGGVLGGFIGLLSPWQYTEIEFWFVTMPMVLIVGAASAYALR